MARGHGYMKAEARSTMPTWSVTQKATTMSRRENERAGIPNRGVVFFRKGDSKKMSELGELKAFDLRKIWQYEDRHFTVWLTENMHRLGQVLGMSLDYREREKAVGPFSLDILAHDTILDRPVVIENQLGQTDHDHLGKLLTYAAGLDARAIVWIAPAFREQHRAALDWLNNHTDETVDFFGVVLEAMQIDDSRPAVNFKLVASPNSWQKSFVEQRAGVELDSRRLFFYQFNEALLAELKLTNSFSNLPNATARYEVMIQRTHGGVRYGTAFSRDTLRVGIWIVVGDHGTNRLIFERLRTDATGLENEIGQAITWDFDSDRIGQTVTVNKEGVSRDKPAEIVVTAKWAAQILAKLRHSLEPRLSAIVPSVLRERAKLRADDGESLA